jgi:hypothetical protein
MPYAGIEDVEIDYGPVSDADKARVLVLIERVEAQLVQRVPDLAARITAGRTSTALVRQVVAEIVAGRLRNPEGYVTGTRSVSNGPFSSTVSGTRAAGAAAGALVLTRQHLYLLGTRRGTQSVSNGDPALSRVAVSQPGGGGVAGLAAGEPEGVHFGCMWPLPWDGQGELPTP